MVGQRRVTFEKYTIRGNVSLGETCAEVVSKLWLFEPRVFEQEFCVWHSVQNFRPRPDHCGRVLGRLVEGAKRELSERLGWRRSHIRCVRRRTIAHIVIWHPE